MKHACKLRSKSWKWKDKQLLCKLKAIEQNMKALALWAFSSGRSCPEFLQKSYRLHMWPGSRHLAVRLGAGSTRVCAGFGQITTGPWQVHRNNFGSSMCRWHQPSAMAGPRYALSALQVTEGPGSRWQAVGSLEYCLLDNAVQPKNLSCIAYTSSESPPQHTRPHQTLRW